MKTIEELTAEIIKEQEALEQKAFEIYCKEELARQMIMVKASKETWNGTVKRLESLTIEKLEKDFDSYSPSRGRTPKETILEMIKNG